MPIGIQPGCHLRHGQLCKVTPVILHGVVSPEAMLVRCRAKREPLKRVCGVLLESQDQVLVLTGRVPREQKMLKGHLPSVIYHQVY